MCVRPQVKLLSKEAEVLAQTQLQTQERLTASEELCQNTHTLLQRRQLEIQDITAVKDSRYTRVWVWVHLCVGVGTPVCGCGYTRVWVWVHPCVDVGVLM